MKIKSTLLALLLGTSFMIITASCGNATEKKEPVVVEKKDTVKAPPIDSSAIEVKSSLPVHPVLNDEAKYIAGMNITSSKSIDSSLTNNKNWKEYAAEFDKSWMKLDTSKIQKMKDWRGVELKEANTKTIFYPFSGADFFNVYTLFPKADSYIMVGLEPVGTLPHFHKGMPKDSISSYLQKVHKSLFEIFNFSFFKTHNMSIDFNYKDLNGTIHLIVLFIERTGNSIVDVKPAGVDKEGKIFNYSTFREQANSGDVNRGTEIDFINADHVLKKAYYFSVNLDNPHLEKNTNFTKMIANNKGTITTYVKSASYLMHKDYFSNVRDLIIANSSYILQDDSGIPYKYFKPETWNIGLYGTYTGSIPLFSGVFQNDLDAAYKAKTGVKPLKFGIGYKYIVGESNLLYFKKK